ncbi:phosphotransferase, partial [Acinetobacter baumannii]
DASFRRYFRITLSEHHFLLMDAPPNLEDCHGFVAIDVAYRANGVQTPKIYAENLDLGFLLLEDFGDALLGIQLNATTVNVLYPQCYQILPKIQ